MSSLSEDIVKYKKGELSPAEMHALEKKALSDPSLADALEGLDSISAQDLSTDLQSIHEKIKRGRKSSVFTPLRIAAGILLLAVASFIVYQTSSDNEELAMSAKKEKPSPKPESPKTSSAAPAQQDSVIDKAAAEPKPAKTDLKPYIAKAKEKKPETVNIASGKASPAESNAAGQASEQPSVSPSEEVSAESVAAAPQAAPEKVSYDLADVKREKEEETKVSKKKEVAKSARATALTSPSHKITGQVLSYTGGDPMPGVSVIVKGTTQGTVTDASGHFQLNLSQPNQELVFSFVGYEAKEINADEKDKLDVLLKEDATQLSEVVVTGYKSSADDGEEPVLKLAEPIGGRKAYDKYLDDNLHYPQQAIENKIKGRVVIEFTVRVDGSIGEFNVIRKLGYGCDEEVIRLVKEGPAWKPTTQDNVAVESNVRVKMKFNPEKKK